MTTGINVRLDAYGNETGGVPVKVEVFDAAFRPQASTWIDAKWHQWIALAPGLYGVRATAPSGRTFEQAVEVKADAMAEVVVPLHEASPHESHEWAYLTQAIDPPGAEVLDEARYCGLWLRLWRRDEQTGDWHREPFAFENANWEDDGVSYVFRAPRAALYVLQVGGPNVPWKQVALPPTYQAMVLARPNAAGEVHPVDVVVSSENWKIETLLTLMQRGDAAQARDWAQEAEIAENMLYGKHSDTSGAAVGGYFLLKTGDLDRLHDWANNLARWFDWMADGPVIHAWQLMTAVRRGRGDKDRDVPAARERLLEASRRGVPLFTEGLRLLRDGLLLFDRHAKGEDVKVRKALRRVGAYAAAADWSSSATTFLGRHPAKPSAASKQGIPRGGPLVYAYDVPFSEMIDAGLVAPGAELVATLEGGEWRCHVRDDGALVYGDGTTFNSLGAAHAALTGSAQGAWHAWRVAETGYGVMGVAEPLRRAGAGRRSGGDPR